MPVLAKFKGIVIRMLISGILGIRLHAFYGNSEMVVAFNPVRVIHCEVPAWVKWWVLAWVQRHQDEYCFVAGNPAAQAQPRRINSPTPGLAYARASWPSTV